MKEISKTLEYKGKEYKLVFNLNVMEVIQDEYGTLENWGKLTDGTEEKMLTNKQVGRMITEIGLKSSAQLMNGVVIDSTQSAEKNA